MIKYYSACFCSLFVVFAIAFSGGAVRGAQGTTSVREKGPLARVGRFVKPPVIDGKAEEKEWQRAVHVGDFILAGSHYPVPEGPTEVRLGYDDGHLYLYAYCNEPLLVAASQRQAEMQLKATSPEDEIILDESLLLLLKAPKGNVVYEIAVNANGIASGAQCQPDALWTGRTRGWQPQWRVAAHEGDGFWAVEMAIPWQELGAKGPAEGETWQIAIARLARGRSEVSSWNPSGAGAHAPEAYGTLLFGGETYGLRLAERWATLEGKENSLKIAFEGEGEAEERRLSIVTEVNSLQAGPASKTPQRERSTFVAGGEPNGPGEAVHQFDARDEGAVQFSWGVYHAASLAPLYRSPWQVVPVESSQVELRLTTAGPYQLVVNDRVLAKGAEAIAKPVRLPLRSGLNQIALLAESGKAKLELESSALGDHPIRWKTATSTIDSATSSTTDDSGWKTATRDAETGEVVGAGNRGAVFRHAIMVRQTRVWPLPHPTRGFAVARGSTQHVTLQAGGVPQRPLRDWEILLEAPRTLEIVGATGFNANREDASLNSPGKPLFSLEKIEGAEGRYRILADKPLAHSSARSILKSLEFMLRVKDDARAPAPEHNPEHAMEAIRYWSSANDGTVSELQQELPVKIVPMLNGRAPSTIKWQLWGGWIGIMDDDAMKAAFFETARKAGFTEVVSSGERAGHHAQQNRLGFVRPVNFQSWALNMAPYVAEHPEARLLDHKGTFRSDLMCMSALLNEGTPFMEEALARFIKAQYATGIVYDFEFRALIGPHSCYCPRCLDLFRKSAALSADALLTPETIRDTYNKEWVDFMARRVAELMVKLKNGVHRTAPDLLFSVYSGYQSPENPSRYGIDWRYLGELSAIDSGGCGYGRSQEIIDATRDALKGIPVLFGELLTPYLTDPLNFDRPASQLTQANLLRRSLDATGGVLIYDRKPMDGLSWYNVGEITRLVAEFEPLFLKKQLSPLAGHDPASVQLLHGEEASLLCVMNMQPREHRLLIRIPEGFASGYHFGSNKSVTPGESVTLDLQPGDAAVYVLKKE